MPTPKAWSLRTYRAATKLLRPVANYALERRLRAGKEDPSRLSERRGIASLPRPEGKLLWMHGASVGESLSILPLVDRLSEVHPELRFLVTTGTVTSAALMADRLPPKAVHHYIPIDQPHFVRAFLDHWKPDAAFFVESELWPVMLGEVAKRKIPAALINGRMSPRTYESWQGRKKAARELLSVFDIIIAQNAENAERFEGLSERHVGTLGNLKLAADKLPAPLEALGQLEGWLDGRPRWLAASTHETEEIQVLSAHRQILAELPDTVLFLAPRHPARGDEIVEICHDHGFPVARRSDGEGIGPDTQVYLADTLGELGTFYSLSDIAFVGGSFPAIGGHNPLEPARLGCAILHGPEVFNFADTYEDMRRSGSAALVRNERDLAASLTRLLTDEMTRKTMADQAATWAEASARTVLEALVEALEPVLEKGGIAA
ncbi:3-deoxy-D-manno-octulosonic acid transferase [Parvularcula sp. ZS-1/3]|uniref:3-deoxy-D-manno-octulosonic acid transferase n=1 Tax=Parvularcula mediterranea TaxID=2732508 RepID=A0A7Y3RMP7_9PROT|nr:3-deoxy-D-manno-octulosonic acid transferase [Parvularcula mediterranea]NNU16406.1 3-deoxy-D-manno-octulosonic acid transferase [Parvularcula mediterranea]